MAQRVRHFLVEIEGSVFRFTTVISKARSSWKAETGSTLVFLTSKYRQFNVLKRKSIYTS